MLATELSQLEAEIEQLQKLAQPHRSYSCGHSHSHFHVILQSVIHPHSSVLNQKDFVYITKSLVTKLGSDILHVPIYRKTVRSVAVGDQHYWPISF